MAWCRSLALFIIFYTESECRETRILNGHDANIEDFPYQASLRYLNSHFCGGLIIRVSKKHILTAAHCIYYATIYYGIAPPHTGIMVVTGTTLRSEGKNSYRIDKIDVHPISSTNGDRSWNDIAIITLKDGIVFKKYQQKISLPDHDFKIGQKVNLTGWGRTFQYPEIYPNQLKLLQGELISTEECQKRVIDPEKTKIYDTENSNGKGTGMCLGDSGGPLGEVVGIVSWTDGDYCGVETSDVSTNVYKLKHFIKSVINTTL